LFDQWEQLIQQVWHCVVWSVGTTHSAGVTLCCLVSGNNSFSRCDTVLFKQCEAIIKQNLSCIFGAVNTIYCRFSTNESCHSVWVCSMYSIFFDVPYPQMLCFHRTHKTGRHLTFEMKRALSCFDNASCQTGFCIYFGQIWNSYPFIL